MCFQNNETCLLRIFSLITEKLENVKIVNRKEITCLRSRLSYVLLLTLISYVCNAVSRAPSNVTWHTRSGDTVAMCASFTLILLPITAVFREASSSIEGLVESIHCYTNVVFVATLHISLSKADWSLTGPQYQQWVAVKRLNAEWEGGRHWGLQYYGIQRFLFFCLRYFGNWNFNMPYGFSSRILKRKILRL